MRQNPNDSERQSTEQPQEQQPPTQGQPPQQTQPPQGQQPPTQGQPPQQTQPPQGQQPPTQGQPPQSAHGQPQQGGQQAPPQGGMQSGMAGQQRQMQQMGPEGGIGAQPPQQMGQEQTLQSVSIDDILQDDVVTAQPDTPLTTVTGQMKEEGVGSVVIVEDNQPVGLLTDRSIALSLEEMPDLDEKTAADIISDTIVTGSDEMSVYDALQRMSDENIRRLPITDDEDTLVGIITLDDIIVLLGKELQDTAEIIQAQSPQL